MDKTLIKQRFAKAVATYEKEAAVQRQIASHMVELMEKYLPEDVHSNVWEIGCGTGMLTRFYLNRFTPEELYLNDLCPEVKPYLFGSKDQCGPKSLKLYKMIRGIQDGEIEDPFGWCLFV